MKKYILALPLVLAACLVGCKQEKNGNLDEILLARQTLTNAEAYFYTEEDDEGNIYYGATADVRKLTVAFSSANLSFDYAAGAFAGEGEFFELEFCVPVDSQSLAVGKYTGGEVAPFAINLENSFAASVNNSTPVNQLPSAIEVNVSKSGDEYTVEIDYTNTWGGKLKGTYTGKIEFKDVALYGEPTEATEFHIEHPESVEIEADEQNEAYWEKYGVTLHTVTITDTVGNTLVIDLEAYDENAIESLPTGEYDAIYSGDWALGDTFADFYRSGKAETSYLLTPDGHYYYLSATAPLVIAYDETGELTTLTFSAESAYGTVVTVAL